MSTLVLNMEEKQVANYKQLATEMSMSLEELVALLLEEFAQSRRAKFLAAKKFVLTKNRQLYKRLA